MVSEEENGSTPRRSSSRVTRTAKQSELSPVFMSTEFVGERRQLLLMLYGDLFDFGDDH